MMNFFRRLSGTSKSKSKKEAMGNVSSSKTTCGGEPSVAVVSKNSNGCASSSAAPKSTHSKCRNCNYSQSENVSRFQVPDDKVSWDVEMPEYKPVEYTAPSVQKNPIWADPDILGEKKFLWNQKDGKINRKSFVHDYKVESGRPLNPFGRTGMKGRGLLGKWGPNHAADPVVTKWKMDENGQKMKHDTSGKFILQFVSIQRKDTHEWAIPGGMVDDDEEVSLTLKREFGEETMNSLVLSEEEKANCEASLQDFFKNGRSVYRGYVDDPRNTDNAWMETVAVNFHDETGASVGRFPLSAGDDAGAVAWVDIHSNLMLYASHSEFIQQVALEKNAHWS